MLIKSDDVVNSSISDVVLRMSIYYPYHDFLLVHRSSSSPGQGS